MVKPWINSEVFGVNEEKAQNFLNEYPSDVCIVPINMPQVFYAPADAPS